MKVKKGDVLKVNNERHGQFTGIASADFDTEVAMFYPIEVCERVALGSGSYREPGEEVPCRDSETTVEVIGGGVW